VKRLATCDLVSDSYKLRMFREIRARMAATALLDRISHSDRVRYLNICVACMGQ
jgi:hypothetical protein